MYISGTFEHISSDSLKQLLMEIQVEQDKLEENKDQVCFELSKREGVNFASNLQKAILEFINA